MRSKAFTIVETLVVILVIGVLATIVYPNFVGFRLRGKLKEIFTVVPVISTAEKYYYVKNGAYRTFGKGAYDSNNSYGTTYDSDIETDLNIMLPKEPEAFCAYEVSGTTNLNTHIYAYVPSCTGHENTWLYMQNISTGYAVKSNSHPYKIYIQADELPVPG